MYVLIQSVVRVRMNIKGLVLHLSCWKGPYALCSKLESDHERLASPLSITTSVLTHKMLSPLLFFLRPVDSSVHSLSRANTPGYHLSWSVGSRWTLRWFYFRCNGTFFFSFLALSLSRWSGQHLLPSAGGCTHSRHLVALWLALTWRSWWGSTLSRAHAKLAQSRALLTTHGAKKVIADYMY